MFIICPHSRKQPSSVHTTLF